MNGAERVYRLLLLAYPRQFRAEYGSEMTMTFRDCRRAADGHGLGFWASIVWDVLRSAPRLRAEEGWDADSHSRRKGMKGIAAIAILGGALQIVNAVMEATAATKGSPSATWLLAIGLVVVVSLMLVGAGVAMLAGSRNAISLAKLSGVACIVSVALTRFIAPWMGGFAMLVGVVFPLAVLAYVWTRRSGSSTRMA